MSNTVVVERWWVAVMHLHKQTDRLQATIDAISPMTRT